MVIRGGEKWCKVVPKGEPDPIASLELAVELGGRGDKLDVCLFFKKQGCPPRPPKKRSDHDKRSRLGQIGRCGSQNVLNHRPSPLGIRRERGGRTPHAPPDLSPVATARPPRQTNNTTDTAPH